jgi:hypothetical protein
MTIRKKIIEFLEQNDFQTIKQISEGIGVKEAIIRTKIFDKEFGMIKKGEVVKVAHKQRRGFFSLPNKHIDKGEALKFLSDFFKEYVDDLMKNEKALNYILENSDRFEKIEKVVKDTELSRIS